MHSDVPRNIQFEFAKSYKYCLLVKNLHNAPIKKFHRPQMVEGLTVGHK
jgi:hypothetical protein